MCVKIKTSVNTQSVSFVHVLTIRNSWGVGLLKLRSLYSPFRLIFILRSWSKSFESRSTRMTLSNTQPSRSIFSILHFCAGSISNRHQFKGLWYPGCLTAHGFMPSQTAMYRLAQRRYCRPHISSSSTLRWRHNGRDSVSNHQPRHCLLNRYSNADQRKQQSSASLAFVGGIHRGPVNCPHKWPVTRKMFPFDDVIMTYPVTHKSLVQFLLHHTLAFQFHFLKLMKTRSMKTGTIFFFHCLDISQLRWRHITAKAS